MAEHQQEMTASPPPPTAPPRSKISMAHFAEKFKEEPMVPIGMGITLGFLGFGVFSFIRGNSVMSQRMMRGRVLAQGVTLAFLMTGAAMQRDKLRRNPQTADKVEQQFQELQATPNRWADAQPYPTPSEQQPRS
ncbi:hypoxia induced protein conserved region-domain-containing protein [Tribonema minus]|uniref:Hypoxia induced protein conserved region-domain-containing protein n=1 Tax=Tribonema minus TaxID=303371 RepID=A0A836CEW1_9STRA|nr:hypoxia induced protein conserved region-domain-containing protein [Tribonema minus]